LLIVASYQEDGSGNQEDDTGGEEFEKDNQDEDDGYGAGNGEVNDNEAESDLSDDEEHDWQHRQQQQLGDQPSTSVTAPISPRPLSKPLASPRTAAQLSPKHQQKQQHQPGVLAPEIAAILEENRCACNSLRMSMQIHAEPFGFHSYHSNLPSWVPACRRLADMLQVKSNSATNASHWNHVAFYNLADTLQSVISRLPLIDSAAANQQQQSAVAPSSSSAASATSSQALQLSLPSPRQGRAIIIE
jgi:hypothetical protein